MTDTENEQIIKPLEAGGLEATPPVLPSPEEEAGTEIKEGEAEPIKEPAEATPVAQETPQNACPPPRRAIPLPAVRDELEVRIEKIMEDGLTDAYSRLSPLPGKNLNLGANRRPIKFTNYCKPPKLKLKKYFSFFWSGLKCCPASIISFWNKKPKLKQTELSPCKKDRSHYFVLHAHQRIFNQLKPAF